MKRIIITLALIAIALPVVLGGCSSGNAQDEYVEINGQKLGINELQEKVRDNELSVLNDYVGKEMTVVAKVKQVSAENSVSIRTSFNDATVQVTCPNGYVTAGTDKTTYYIQISDSDKSVTSGLHEGDLIKATGIFSGFSDYGRDVEIDMLAYDGHEWSDGLIPTIEKA